MGVIIIRISFLMPQDHSWKANRLSHLNIYKQEVNAGLLSAMASSGRKLQRRLSAVKFAVSLDP